VGEHRGVASTQGDEAEQPGAPPSVGRELGNALQVAASILGLAFFVYLIGGIVSWVRFGAPRLPRDAAVEALESRTLFETRQLARHELAGYVRGQA
jgi:hypothetical protein